MKVAIVHDDLTQRGGAERVVLSLCRLFPDAPVFTTVYDAENTFPEFREVDIRTTFLQRAPKRNPRALLPLYPTAVRSIDLRGYDLVVSSTSRFAHGVRVPDGTHVAYCHNPARFLYQADTYFGDDGAVSRATGRWLGPVLAALRRWDQAAARRPDLYVANSHTVAERIEQAYGRRATVVHPPLDLRRFEAAPATASQPPFFLVISRLLPYKRVDLAIDACVRAGRRLVVVGTGPAEASLRARAADAGVEFRRDLTDAQLTELLATATALIQPGLEDFGFAPLETNAAGRPAIAYAAGGALETVVDGVTGIHVHHQSVDAFASAIHRCKATAWDGAKLGGHARGFDEPRFHSEIIGAIEGAGYPIPRKSTSTS